MTTDLDQAAVKAVANLVGRTGASDLEFGYVNDVAPHGWYVSCRHQGSKIFVDGFDHPNDAIEAFVARILDGGLCIHCEGRTITRATAIAGQPIGLSPHVAIPKNLDRAERRRLERAAARDAAAKPPCVWDLIGGTWRATCAEFEAALAERGSI